MINKIEIDFALPVELTDREMQVLDSLIQRVAKRHEPAGMVHWCAECGDKPSFSQADAQFLGKTIDPNAPVTGEPTFDSSILYFATFARESYPEEEARKAWRIADRDWLRLPWWHRMFTHRPEMPRFDHVKTGVK